MTTREQRKNFWNGGKSVGRVYKTRVNHSFVRQWFTQIHCVELKLIFGHACKSVHLCNNLHRPFQKHGFTNHLSMEMFVVVHKVSQFTCKMVDGQFCSSFMNEAQRLKTWHDKNNKSSSKSSTLVTGYNEADPYNTWNLMSRSLIEGKARPYLELNPLKIQVIWGLSSRIALLWMINNKQHSLGPVSALRLSCGQLRSYLYRH